ncbi:hypothetical protein LLEC1_01257 [Akanthomyces lecanii]|uniref:Uncharacterized protein n=1 Tax=Cordyceps confragosa TaxID=2714763 RepID=A0A179IJ60_CORDF|nr:hypothetical protein LLEC1_01257 [Akanthomyces lecanii]
MKFAVALTFASTAMAGIVARDASVVKGVISTSQTDIDSVKTAVDAYKGDKTDLVKAADQLVSDLKAGKTKVEGSDDLSLNDAVDLTAPVQSLTKSGSALTDSLTARKSEVEKAGECKTVQDQIAAISESSKGLIDAVTAKVPEAAQSIAKSLSDPLIAVTVPTGAAALFAPAGVLAAVAAALALGFVVLIVTGTNDHKNVYMPERNYKRAFGPSSLRSVYPRAIQQRVRGEETPQRAKSARTKWKPVLFIAVVVRSYERNETQGWLRKILLPAATFRSVRAAVLEKRHRRPEIYCATSKITAWIGLALASLRKKELFFPHRVIFRDFGTSTTPQGRGSGTPRSGF